MPLRKSAWMLLPLLAVMFAVMAEAQIITSSLEGTVRDSSQAVIPGAKVRLTNVGTNAQVNLTTGEDGRYLAPSLPPGEYFAINTNQSLEWISAQGFPVSAEQMAAVATSVARETR